MYALIILFVAGVVSLFAGLFTRNHKALQAVALLGLLGALGSIVYDFSAMAVSGASDSWQGMLSFDGYSASFSVVVLVAASLIVGLSGYSFRHLKDAVGDHYGLLLFSLCGALCMFAFSNLVMLFLGIEILSIPLYVLAGSQRENLSSNEAALKYYLMGAFATGILLFGIALVYGSTGTFEINGLARASAHNSLFVMGVLMMMAGLTFKVGAAPFHFWTPDVYEGAPSIVTSFMATVVKTAAIAAFFRMFTVFMGSSADWVNILAVISALTMTIGNVTAIYQTSMKRMLAYSSISHAGYMLMTLVAIPAGIMASTPPVFALLFYTLAYSVATICIFAGFIIVSEQSGGKASFDIFNGLAKRKPFLAFTIALCMLSLAGIPPTAGFFGKYFVFSSVFAAYPWLVGIAVINSCISIYYYFKVILAMYFTPENESNTELSIPFAYNIVMAIGILAVLGMSFLPAFLNR